MLLRGHGCCDGQELVAIAHRPSNHCVQSDREGTGSPPCCVSCLREGRMWCYRSISFSPSLILPRLLLTSSSSSVTKVGFSTSVHLPQGCSLFLSSTGVTAGHTLQPEAWVVARSPWSIAWEAMTISCATG